MLTENKIQISPAEWQMWRNQPTTIAVFEALAAERSAWVQQLAFGGTLLYPGSEIKDTAKAVGVVQGLTYLLEEMEQDLQDQWAESQRKEEEDVD